MREEEERLKSSLAFVQQSEKKQEKLNILRRWRHKSSRVAFGFRCWKTNADRWNNFEMSTREPNKNSGMRVLAREFWPDLSKIRHRDVSKELSLPHAVFKVLPVIYVSFSPSLPTREAESLGVRGHAYCPTGVIIRHNKLAARKKLAVVEKLGVEDYDDLASQGKRIKSWILANRHSYSRWPGISVCPMISHTSSCIKCRCIQRSKKASNKIH
ncbi:hypothetical protein DAPPUDRAFT_107155 [Daphnia pulex]|uniref:Uncharacterized protein n=1 Tax=Daphnia pulex TaxID=6669 RepID=E9GW54_DAPPU|nr:hypothetical protein DAPPUDRAFT_107155 [Daphnia pulex]|eukprot:EFX76286.1 hypothetical protein DAPPUDRAFT_107155 [Daphnia pulex]